MRLTLFCKMFAAAGVVAFTSACATTTVVPLPNLDAAKTKSAPALLVAANPGKADLQPKSIVKGSGDGALRGMGGYLSSGRGGGGLVMLLFAPIGLPIAATVGASKAHSEAEVNAAIEAVNAVAQDTALMQSIDLRFVEALSGTKADKWSCLAAASASDTPPCNDHTPQARVELRPSFWIREYGDFNPDIHLFGEVMAVVSLDPATAGKKPRQLVRGKWQLRSDIGSFMGLAKNGAAPLRQKIESYLDRFAAQIVRDLYLEPRRQSFNRRKEPLKSYKIIIPPNVVTRIE